MTDRALTNEQANAVYDILTLHAGAREKGRIDFVHHQTAGVCTEYRFQADLGFGGKFWNTNGRWYVTAYREDLERWPQIGFAVDAANAALTAAHTDARSRG